MKIAFFLGEFPVLSETFVIRQINGVVEAGHEVCIVIGKWGERNIAHEKYHGNRLESLVHPLRKGIDGSLSRAALLTRFMFLSFLSTIGRRRLTAALRAAVTGCPAALLDIAAQSRHGTVGNFDAVIAHFGPVGVRAMYLQQAGLIGGPIATIFHGFDMSDTATVKRNLGNYRRLFDRTAMLLPISELWRQRLHKWGAPQIKTRVLRMGVDVEQVPMLPAARPLAHPLRVLSVARFTEKKGLEYAIRGVAQARSPINYMLIGAGVLEAKLHEAAADAPAGSIRFLGKQPQQKVFEALDQTDVFLLPSVTAKGGDMEGIPVVLMEAMAKGVLVLATRHSAIPELIEEGVSGMLVAERDAEGIAHALDKIAAGQLNIASMRLQARHTVEKKFNNAVLDQELLEICHSMQTTNAG